MKKKMLSLMFQVVWIALLICSLLYPRSAAPVIVVASVWVICFFAWLLVALSSIGWFTGGRARAEMQAAIARFIATPVRPVRSWIMRLLIVISLALSQGAITLVFYMLTVAMLHIIRSQLSCRVTV